MGKSLTQMAQEVEAQRRAVQANSFDDDLDSASGGTGGYTFSRQYTGELVDEDDLVIGMQDGLGNGDSPWPLSDLFVFCQGVIAQSPPGKAPRGTLTVKVVFIPEGDDDEE